MFVGTRYFSKNFLPSYLTTSPSNRSDYTNIWTHLIGWEPILAWELQGISWNEPIKSLPLQVLNLHFAGRVGWLCWALDFKVRSSGDMLRPVPLLWGQKVAKHNLRKKSKPYTERKLGDQAKQRNNHTPKRGTNTKLPFLSLALLPSWGPFPTPWIPRDACVSLQGVSWYA